MLQLVLQRLPKRYKQHMQLQPAITAETQCLVLHTPITPIKVVHFCWNNFCFAWLQLIWAIPCWFFRLWSATQPPHCVSTNATKCHENCCLVKQKLNTHLTGFSSLSVFLVMQLVMSRGVRNLAKIGKISETFDQIVRWGTTGWVGGAKKAALTDLRMFEPIRVHSLTY